MVKFIDIDPKDIDTTRMGRRGRVSYPILKAFLERNSKVSKLDLTGLKKNPQYMRSVLQSYITTHNMPIRVFSANGDLHLMRLDIENDGTPIPDWDNESDTTDGGPGTEENVVAVPLDDVEVDKRFKEEKGQSTK